MRYEVDPYNRLILRSGKRSDLHKFRKVLDGRFKVKNNELSYHVKSPASGDKNEPHQIKLKGKWSLTDNHDLRITLDKLGRETLGDEVTLQGGILDVKANSILFAVTTRTKENAHSTYILDLKGVWRADENNRLLFHVKKTSGKHDILTFKGIWEVNKNHEIIYQYEKKELIKKKSRTHTLTFKGHWDIKDKIRIAYALSGSGDSEFHFTSSAGIFKENYIKYELGIGLNKKTGPVRRSVTLFGAWKITRNAGLIFETKYANKKVHAATFGAEARLSGKDTILFKLKNNIENRDIGISVKLSRKVLKGNGEAFMRVLRSNRGSAVYVGIARGW